LITAEEAHDYPDEAKPQQPRDITPRNPLDMVANAQSVVQITHQQVESEVELEVNLEADLDVDLEVEPKVEVEVTSSPDEPAVVPGFGFPLYVPGKPHPHSNYQSLDEWQDAYEDLADKTARAGKRPARERMTILRELKECNEDTIKRVDTVKRVRHTAAYSKRLAALGASQ
jgi:hypothetical protein